MTVGAKRPSARFRRAPAMISLKVGPSTRWSPRGGGPPRLFVRAMVSSRNPSALDVWSLISIMYYPCPRRPAGHRLVRRQHSASGPLLGSSLVIHGVPWEVRGHTTKCLPTEVLPYGVQRRGELRSSRPFTKRDFLYQAGSRPTGAAASCSAIHSLFW